jgi:16S rRNA (cytidine1402-2'-O)-methyltransferase
MSGQEGKLYLVSTPIGNLADITLRALEVLKSVDLIAAEDTRHTRQLLTHFDIHTRLISYHAYNEHVRTAKLLAEIESGVSIAVVTDAGTPAIADPGFMLVREAVRAGIEPVIIPGVSALTFAATAAALPVDRFAFYGFPPVKSGRKRQFFERIAAEDKTVFVYESPHRIAGTLALIAEVLGPETPLALIREATKIHEETLRGTAGELAAQAAAKPLRGELVIAISPRRGADGVEEDAE